MSRIRCKIRSLLFSFWSILSSLLSLAEGDSSLLESRPTDNITGLLMPTLPTMADVALDNVQGDLFSRGFPKYYESYYFFSIVQGKEKDFCKALKALVSEKDKHISSLTKVIADWAKIDGVAKHNRENPSHKQFIPTSNALIAFTKRGLDKVITRRSHLTSMLSQIDSSWLA